MEYVGDTEEMAEFSAWPNQYRITVLFAVEILDLAVLLHHLHVANFWMGSMQKREQDLVVKVSYSLSLDSIWEPLII